MKSMLDILGMDWIQWYLERYYGLKKPDPVKSPYFHYVVTGDVKAVRRNYLKATRESAKEVERIVQSYRQSGVAGARESQVVPCEAVPHKGLHSMAGSWMGAAIAGDMDLAKRVTAPLAAPNSRTLKTQLYLRDYCLRHALAQDAEAEAKLVAKLKPGYVAGFPQPLIEFPIGVFKRDAAMVLEGVRKTNTRFKTQWDEKKWRAWYDKPRGRKSSSWEECLLATKAALFNYNWVLAHWALAWLNVASWRGMDAVFENPKKFSQWIPLELARSKPA